MEDGHQAPNSEMSETRPLFSFINKIWPYILVVAVIFIVYQLFFKTDPDVLTVGSQLDLDSEYLNVWGADMEPGETVYIRYYSAKKFRTSHLTLVLESKKGAGWMELSRKSFAVNPNYNVQTWEFIPSDPGEYKAYIMKNGKIAAETLFRVKGEGD